MPHVADAPFPSHATRRRQQEAPSATVGVASACARGHLRTPVLDTATLSGHQEGGSTRSWDRPRQRSSLTPPTSSWTPARARAERAQIARLGRSPGEMRCGRPCWPILLGPFALVRSDTGAEAWPIPAGRAPRGVEHGVLQIGAVSSGAGHLQHAVLTSKKRDARGLRHDPCLPYRSRERCSLGRRRAHPGEQRPTERMMV